LKRHGTFFWIAGTVALVIGLLYREQVALLYILSTLAMCALLMVVAFSDLKGKDAELQNNVLDKTPTSSEPATSQKKVEEPRVGFLSRVPLLRMEEVNE
jgi:hypothetical protein